MWGSGFLKQSDRGRNRRMGLCSVKNKVEDWEGRGGVDENLTCAVEFERFFVDEDKTTESGLILRIPASAICELKFQLFHVNVMKHPNLYLLISSSSSSIHVFHNTRIPPFFLPCSSFPEKPKQK